MHYLIRISAYKVGNIGEMSSEIRRSGMPAIVQPDPLRLVLGDDYFKRSRTGTRHANGVFFGVAGWL